jgi:hypothetical protein
MTAQDLLNNSLTNLQTLEKTSYHLDFDQAIDLARATEYIKSILTGLKKEGKDWEAEKVAQFMKTSKERTERLKNQLVQLEEYSGADLATADMIIEACRQ